MNCIEPFRAAAFCLQCFIVSLIGSYIYFYILCAFVAKPVEVVYTAIAGKSLTIEQRGRVAALPAVATDENEDEDAGEELVEEQQSDHSSNDDTHRKQTASFTTYRHVPPTATWTSFEPLPTKQQQQKTHERILIEQTKPAQLSTEQTSRLEKEETAASTVHISQAQVDAPRDIATERIESDDDHHKDEQHGDNIICNNDENNREGAVLATPQPNMATVIMQRMEKKGRLTMPQMFQRRSARWQRIVFTHKTGQLLSDTPSNLCNEVLPKDEGYGEQQVQQIVLGATNEVTIDESTSTDRLKETYDEQDERLAMKSRDSTQADDLDQYVLVEKHTCDPEDTSHDETDEAQPPSHKRQKVEPQQEAAHEEPVTSITTDGFELVSLTDAGGPPVPPASPMQIDTLESPQICIEPIEELIQKLHALKLSEDSDEFVSVNMDDIYSSQMDVFSTGTNINNSFQDQMQMDHRSGSGQAFPKNHNDQQIFSARMDDVQVDIPNDARLHIELDMTMRDIDIDDDDDNEDTNATYHFSSRFPTPETYSYNSRYMDQTDSDTESDDCDMVDLSDALSMLSLMKEPTSFITTPSDPFDKSLKAIWARKVRERQMGSWWCRCTKTRAGDVVTKAKKGLRTKTENSTKLAKTTKTTKTKMPVEKIGKARPKKATRLPRFPWHFNYWL
ncbi:hypothetical protein SBRCBS47491_007616 [Sporothrix bragantina]|uniref:Uncharacterized protein n=1 Tax=Sporothrix bragantina TaxID=671064 RepID=A0ABP0CEQ0_9PEZI